VNNSKDNQVIKLPDKRIEIDYLIIKRPLKFVGSPGSIIEVHEGIVIDLDNPLYPVGAVIFEQCSIHFLISTRFFLLK